MNAYRMTSRAPFIGVLALLIALQAWPTSRGAIAAGGDRGGGGNLGGGNVMPGSASALGYDLDDVAAALARFSDAGNDPALLPSTPFQVIYDNGSDVFDVKPATRLFVPILSVSDSPPVLGVYPSDESELASYYFDPTQIGIQGAQIEVDGKVTDVGPDYIGAVFDVALPNGGSNYSELGVLLTPLNKGTHKIVIRAAAIGDLVLDTYGFPISFELTYTVNVK
jgi:hypothetical protein